MIRWKTTVSAALAICAALCGAISGCAVFAPPGPPAPAATRTAAERLTASQFRAVAIMVGLGPTAASYTFTGMSVIARLVSLLNSLPASTGTGSRSCPSGPKSFTITFQPRSAAGTPVTVFWSYCRLDQVTADGGPQPALDDPGNEVAGLAAQLTHTGPL
jgi:hypothetical protein